MVLRHEAVRERLLRLEGVDPRSDSQLSACGVIDSEVRERFRGLGGFRNLLVHGCLKLDANRVAELLADAPERFSALARAIRAWLPSVR